MSTNGEWGQQVVRASATRAPANGRGQRPTIKARRNGISTGNGPSGEPVGYAMRALAVLWIFILFDPGWWLGRNLLLLTVPKVLYVLLGAALVLGFLGGKSWSRRWTWYAPLLCFISTAVLALPWTPAPSRWRDAFTAAVMYWFLIVATVAIVDTARRAEKLLLLYVAPFLIFGLLGAQRGLIAWHPVLANYDGYGSFTVVGGGLCGFLILAADKGWLRKALMLTVMVCVVGLVASFARGALVAAVAVAGVVWLRSPRKGQTLALGVACGLLLMGAAALLYGDAYWAEMKTILEGTGEATGEDRWVMWGAALHVWTRSPIFGVGLSNWGVVAAETFRPGDIGGVYALNPQRLWGIEAHNTYVEVLAEQGIVGAVAFVWVFVDFWRRNAVLRSAAAAERWAAMGGRLRLRAVALGLEAGLVGCMAAAALYSTAGQHWMFTLLGLNLLFHQLVVNGAPELASHASRTARARRLTAPRVPAVGRARVRPSGPLAQ